ncbi:LysR family transcriptional regulator [Streptococcus sp. DD13]|uniref:LysR family transcriptional regulator n=1 Tax=Streptococcus sp. DD13 TaxID=1777881 RepID=UPI00079650BA|nr:LysR family transcriptional regulator [Streptococcus sp. DD13]KXT77584.1 LysR family transcriptional regulator [Streptococcus sp. DD13]
MDASKCQAVIAASETGSFSAAAALLNYTQSGITRMISSLEEELEFPLFIRSKKGVRLTENGQLMLPYFREIVESQQLAREVSEDIKGIVRGAITIGCYFSVSSMWMPVLLKFFSEAYPQIHIKLMEGGNKEIAKWLMEQSVDICLCAQPEDKSAYDWEELYQDPLVVWLPTDHPKARQKTYAIKDLEQEAFIHTLPDQDTDQDRLIAQEKLTLTTRFTTKDGFTTYQLVKAGLGVSFNQSMIARDWKSDVVQIPLHPKRYVSLGIALPKKDRRSPAVERFLDTCRELLPTILPTKKKRESPTE